MHSGSKGQNTIFKGGEIIQRTKSSWTLNTMTTEINSTEELENTVGEISKQTKTIKTNKKGDRKLGGGGERIHNK